MSDLDFKWCHYFRCGQERHAATHCHEWNELLVLTEGIYHAKIGKKSFQAHAGDVVLFRGGQTHWEVNDTEHPPAFYVITFFGGDSMDFFPTLMHDRHGRIRTLCQWLNEQWWWEMNFNREYPLGILMSILSELRHAVASVSNPFVEGVRQYLQDHLEQPLTTGQIARHVGLSRSQFCLRYEAEAHLTPMAELRRMRMFHARTLLQTTALPMKEIARKIGLSSGTALAHLFQKHMRLTPSAVRLGTGKTREALQSQFDRGEKEY